MDHYLCTRGWGGVYGRLYFVFPNDDCYVHGNIESYGSLVHFCNPFSTLKKKKKKMLLWILRNYVVQESKWTCLYILASCNGIWASFTSHINVLKLKVFMQMSSRRSFRIMFIFSSASVCFSFFPWSCRKQNRKVWERPHVLWLTVTSNPRKKPYIKQLETKQNSWWCFENTELINWGKEGEQSCLTPLFVYLINTFNIELSYCRSMRPFLDCEYHSCLSCLINRR